MINANSQSQLTYSPIWSGAGVTEEQNAPPKADKDETGEEFASHSASKSNSLVETITKLYQRFKNLCLCENTSETADPNQSPQDQPSPPLLLLDSHTIENILSHIDNPNLKEGFCYGYVLGKIHFCHEVDRGLSAVFHAWQIQDRLNDRFGVPPQSISTHEEAMKFIAEVRRKVNIMNDALPKELRSKIPIKDLITNTPSCARILELLHRLQPFIFDQY